MYWWTLPVLLLFMAVMHVRGMNRIKVGLFYKNLRDKRIYEIISSDQNMVVFSDVLDGRFLEIRCSELFVIDTSWVLTSEEEAGIEALKQI